jgi:hypothetical protein
MQSADDIITAVKNSEEFKTISIAIGDLEKEQLKPLMKKMMSYYGETDLEDDLADNLYKHITDLSQNSSNAFDNEAFIEEIIRSFDKEESRGQGDKKVTWTVMQRIKDPAVATGRKSETEVKTDLEIIQDSPSLNRALEKFIQSGEIKKILNRKVSTDNKDRRDSELQQKESEINNKIISFLSSNKEYEESISNRDFKEREATRYEELYEKDKRFYQGEDEADELTKEERKELEYYESQAEKIDKGKRIRNFVSFLVTGLGDPQNKTDFTRVQQEFAKRMIKEKEVALDKSYKAQDNEAAQQAQDNEDAQPYEDEIIKKIQEKIGDEEKDGTWDEAVTTSLWQQWLEKNKDKITSIALIEGASVVELEDLIADIIQDTGANESTEENFWGWTDIYNMISEENQRAFPNSYEGMLKFIEYQEGRTGDDDELGQSEQEETASPKVVGKRINKDYPSTMAPVDFVDYQENTPVPINNLSLMHPDLATKKIVFHHSPVGGLGLTGSKFKSYNSYKPRFKEVYNTLDDFLKDASEEKLGNRQKLSDVQGGAIFYKDFIKSYKKDAHGADTFLFASDVHLKWEIDPSGIDEEESKKKGGKGRLSGIKDGTEAVLFIDGPTFFNLYIKGYKYDASKNMFTQNNSYTS